MDLEIPVLARNIPGNAAIIKHKETGLLFSNPQVRKPRLLRFIFYTGLCLSGRLAFPLSSFPQILLFGAVLLPPLHLQFRELVLGVSLAECLSELLRATCCTGVWRFHDWILQEMLWMCQISLQVITGIGICIRQTVAHQKRMSLKFQMTHFL